jgi:hypothetical protein
MHLPRQFTTNVAIGLAFLVGACAHTGIEQLSDNTYRLNREDHGGSPGSAAALKAGAIREADEFAKGQGKVAVPLQSHATPTAFGRPATFEYKFRLVDPAVLTKDGSEKPTDLYTELLKLDDLRKRGILTDAEFEAQKQKLLAR